MKFAIEKTFPNLPCAHQQWFDVDSTKELFSGACAKFHGYDRSVKFKIEGEVDQHGWVFPFGAFKKIRTFLEYYFDHTAVIPADDPRLADVIKLNNQHQLFNLRVLPYGVSMEMSALFIYQMVQPYVMRVTDGRCSIVDIECREHEKNSGSLSMTWAEGQAFVLADYGNMSRDQYIESTKSPIQCSSMIMRPQWKAVPPKEALDVMCARIEGQMWKLSLR